MGALVTRRGIIATAFAAPAIPAVSMAQSLKISAREAEFVRCIAGLHPNGFEAAVHALELGMDPEKLVSIDFVNAHSTELPALTFGRLHAERICVTPIDFFSWRTGISTPRGWRA